jgi:Uma2 family endonuclease
MGRPVRRPATYDDLVRLPENMVGEILDGELHASPRPRLRHALAASSLTGEILGPFQNAKGGPGGWWILAEPELHLGPDVLVPDLGGWRRERLPVFPDDAAMTLAPDWVCEVISPSTGRIDRVKKLPIYARESVAHAWIVDPVLRTLEVFRREGSAWLLAFTASDGDVVRAAPFEAIEIDLLALWGETRPAP